MLKTIVDLRNAIRHGGDSSPSESEEVFAAVLRCRRNGLPGPPTAAGSAFRVPLDYGSPAMVLYDPDVPESIFSSRFESVFANRYGRPSRLTNFRRPEPAFVDAVLRGRDLLARLLPALATSALAHVHLIGVPSDWWHLKNGFTRHLPSTMSLSTGVLQSPWKTAEALLHEALHCKLINLMGPRLIFRWRDAVQTLHPRIPVIWRKDPLGNGLDWSVNHALAAFHVYVHLALFFARIERAGNATDAFGAPPVSFREGFRTVFDRASYLGRKLAATDGLFYPDGRRLIAWLSQMLLRLSDCRSGSDRRYVTPTGLKSPWRG